MFQFSQVFSQLHTSTIVVLCSYQFNFQLTFHSEISYRFRLYSSTKAVIPSKYATLRYKLLNIKQLQTKFVQNLLF